MRQVTVCYLPLRAARGDRKSLRLAKRDRLSALPQRHPAEVLQLLLALHEGCEVVRPQLAGLALEVAVAVGEEKLRLAFPAWVERDLAGMRIRRGVLGADPEVAV